MPATRGLARLDSERRQSLIFRACDLPSLRKPKKNQFFRVNSIPVLGAGKVELRSITALAFSKSRLAEAKAEV
jgi:hypothetical protein